MSQTQVRNAQYALEVDPQNTKHVLVHKFTKDLELLETYHINIHPTFTICSCWAGAKPEGCRHQKMFHMWNKYQIWGKGWMYNFDKGTWLPPSTPEDS